MKWFISILILTLSVELMAQTTAISVVENPSSSDLAKIQDIMNDREGVIDFKIINVDLNSLQNEESFWFDFYDLKLVLYRNKLERRSEYNFTWFGGSSDKFVSVVITVKGNTIHAVLSSLNGVFAIETFGDTYVLEKIDQGVLPSEKCDNFEGKNNKNAIFFKNAEEEGDEPVFEEFPAPGCKLRVLVFYTPKAAEAAGTDMEVLAQNAIDGMNNSFNLSNINYSAELVLVEQTNFSETTLMEQDLTYFRDDNDGVMDDVHIKREEYAADVCVLLLDNSTHITKWCGQAASMRSSREKAFVAVHWWCAKIGYSLPHEIGHLFGAQHAVVDVTFPPLDADYPFAHGFKNASSSWRTIMAYDCPSGCNRLPYWSDKNATINGDPRGDANSHNVKMIKDNFERLMFLRRNGQIVSVTNNDVNVSWVKSIYTGGRIQTSGIVNIQWGRNYRFIAEESISLDAGFEVVGGAQFEAYVTSCGEEGEGDVDYNPLPDQFNKNDNQRSSSETKSDYTLYPNPVAREINIKSIPNELSNYDVVIFSTDGKKLIKLNGVSAQNGRLDPIIVENLPTGMYYLQLISEDQTVKVYKFIKK